MAFYTKMSGIADVDSYSMPRNITLSEMSRDTEIRLNHEKKPR